MYNVYICVFGTMLTFIVVTSNPLLTGCLLTETEKVNPGKVETVEIPVNVPSNRIKSK